MGTVLLLGACAAPPPPESATRTVEPVASGSAVTRPCRPTEPVPPNNQLQAIMFGNDTRTYVLSVPSGYDGTRPAPVIFDFYGRDGDAEEQVADYELDDEAIAAGFLVVTPQAAPDRDHARNAWVGDTALIPSILESLERRWCIDRNAVFVAGFSDGGVFAAHAACALPGLFAALATVAELSYPQDCPTSAQFSVIGFHGRSDPLVPFDGGATGDDDGRSGLPGSPDELAPSLPIETTFADFAEHNGCQPEPRRLPVMPEVEHLTYPGCRADLAVELFIIDDGGHEWPGDPGPEPADADDLDANALMLQFFDDHRRR